MPTAISTTCDLRRRGGWPFRGGWWTLLLLWPGWLSGCYEVPPEITEDYYRAAVEPGWPPLAVYHADPFHPANLLFHRLFILGAGPRGGDFPVSRRGPLDRVDRAEIGFLCERVRATLVTGEDGLSGPGLTLLMIDLENETNRLRERRGPGDPEVVESLDDLLRALRAGAVPVGLPPPPEGATIERPDRPGDHPAPTPGGLEAWRLEGRRGVEIPRILHLSRARWLRGEEPWVEVSAEAPWVVRAAPGDAVAVREADVAGLCGGCHPGRDPPSEEDSR